MKLKGGEIMSRAEYLRQWRKKKKDIAGNIKYILEITFFLKSIEDKKIVAFKGLNLEQVMFIKSNINENENFLSEIKVQSF